MVHAAEAASGEIEATYRQAAHRPHARTVACGGLSMTVLSCLVPGCLPDRPLHLSRGLFLRFSQMELAGAPKSSTAPTAV